MNSETFLAHMKKQEEETYILKDAKPMSFRDAVEEAVKTGLQFRRAGRGIEYPCQFIGLDYKRSLDQRYTSKMNADDILANDWFMVPLEWMDCRPGVNVWKYLKPPEFREKLGRRGMSGENE